MDFMREMRRSEEAEVEALLTAAFGGKQEVRLVRHLRSSGAIAGESVVPTDGRIMGYFALSWMDSPNDWLCLAPVAVLPAWQRRGTGRRMIGMLSEWARLAGQYVIVLGDVGYYSKAGFSAERAAKLKSPFPIEHTLLAGPGEDVPERSLIYPEAFSAL